MQKKRPITNFMDKVTILQELVSEVETMQKQLEVIKQRLKLAEVNMQAETAALQASELRIKQLEMMLANAKSEATPQTPVAAPAEPVCDPDVALNSLKTERDEAGHTAEPKVDHPSQTTQNPLQVSPGAEKKDARLVSDLRKAIGLNDRFRLKHDLFNNDETLMLDTIDALNVFTTMTDAAAYLSERFSWKADDATVVYFYEILERKYVRP